MSNQSRDDIKVFLNEWSLSEREKEIIHLMVQGHTTQKDLGEKLNISPLTIRNHMDNIYKKTGHSNKCDLIVAVFNKVLTDYQQLKPFIQQAHILIVDDDATICKHLKEELIEQGHHAEYLTSAAALEKALETTPYDFVLIDVRINGATHADGVYYTENLKNKFEHINFVIMSGFYDYSMEKTLNAGAITYLEKPFSIDELLDIISFHQITNLKQRFEFFHVDQEVKKTLNTSLTLKPEQLGRGGICTPLTQNDIDQLDLKVGDHISLVFSIPEFQLYDIEAIGLIRWIREQSPNQECAMGIEFLLLSKEVEYRIKRLVQKEAIYSFIPSCS